MLGGLLFVALGVLLLWTGSPLHGLIALLFSVISFLAVPAARAQSRGEPPWPRKRLVYALIALGLGVVIGGLFLVFAPDGGTTSGRLLSPDTPAEVRLLGGALLLASLAGLITVSRRMTRQR